MADISADNALPLGRRIFVASTHDDLVDIRAELYRYLLELGLIPIMSEGRFPPTRAVKESVESRCLANVEMADVVLVILSERYGSSPGPDGISYTHMEYRQAETCGKKILVYVRTALWALREHCKGRDHSNPQSPDEYANAYRSRLVSAPAFANESGTSPNDPVPRLLAFVHECEQPKHRGKQIIRTFDTVVDLKDHIRNDLTANLLVASYEELLREGRLPFISVSDARPRAPRRPGADLYLRLANATHAPAAFGSDSGLYVELSTLVGTPADRATPPPLPSTGATGSAEGIRPAGSLVLKDGTMYPLLATVPGKWSLGAPFAARISARDWSPTCPSVMRETDEYLARIDLTTFKAGTGDLSCKIRVWVIYQATTGMAHHIADAYDVALKAPSREDSAVEVRSAGKHLVLNFDSLDATESRRPS